MVDSALPELSIGTPFLVEAEGGTSVDSLKLLHGGTVRLPIVGMLPTDLITLHWPIQGSPYPPLEPRHGVEGEHIDIPVPPRYIALWLDDYAVFTCTVKRGEDEHDSDQGSIRINLPSNLPQVGFAEVEEHAQELDISLLCCKGPTLFIKPWAFIGTNQTINAEIIATNPDGSKTRLRPYRHDPVNEDDVRDGWRRVLDPNELKELGHNIPINIYCEVRFRQDFGAVYRMFKTRSLMLLTEPHLTPSACELQEATYVDPDGWQVNPINTVNGGHIVVSYDHMCPDDWVCPTFSGAPGVGSPALECAHVANGESSISFPVPASAFSANFGQKISLSYSVQRCDGTLWDALPRDVKVLGITGLPTPQVAEATNEVLDLNTFAGKDATGKVAVWDYMEEGEYCWLSISGKREDDAVYEYQVLVAQPLDPQWLEDGVSTALDRRELAKFADCSDITLKFWASFNKKTQFESATRFPVRTLQIIQDNLVLKAPRVLEAVDGTLVAWNGRDGVTVRVAYEGISGSHTIRVCWMQTNGTCLPLASKQGSRDPKHVDFLIPREAVIDGIGKITTINYSVTSACKQLTSDDLDLEIIASGDLPTPVVKQATNGILDLHTFPGNADITVEPWWFIKSDQKVWLRGVGVLAAGGAYTFNVYLGKAVTAAEVSAGLANILNRAQLNVLANTRDLIFTCKVTADGSPLESNAAEFPKLQLKVITPLNDFTPFTGNQWRSWLAGTAANGEMRYATYFGKTCVANGTASTAKVGAVLYKYFYELRVGHRYEFSILACTYNGAAPLPRLSLRTSVGAVTSIVTFNRMAWTPLQGSFVANSTSMRLEIWSHEPTGISGNDYAITDIRVRG